MMSEVPTLGASGAIYGVVTAFTLLWPDRTIMLLFPADPDQGDLVRPVSVRAAPSWAAIRT